MKVIIAGGGIGGLSLALSLHQAGIAVRVYEAVREPASIGVGINLQPTAVRELTELGLGDELARTGLATRAFPGHAFHCRYKRFAISRAFARLQRLVDEVHAVVAAHHHEIWTMAVLLRKRFNERLVHR